MKKIFISLLLLNQFILAGPARITKEDIAKFKGFRFEVPYKSHNPERLSLFSSENMCSKYKSFGNSNEGWYGEFTMEPMHLYEQHQYLQSITDEDDRLLAYKIMQRDKNAYKSTKTFDDYLLECEIDHLLHQQEFKQEQKNAIKKKMTSVLAQLTKQKNAKLILINND